ncbi:hypothetical protein ACYA6D_21020, partial [Klebsiella pneumoniae]|uniref:hypothetical protein n=1 Tax=Klebsiella pneumoniae TaxID=573 RepID=UPI00296541F6
QSHGEAHYRNRQRQSVGILRKSGGVKSPKKNNLLLFVRESMQQWRAFRGYFNFQLNDKKLRKRSAYFSTNITSRKISHSKKNLKNHLLKCKYGA